METKPIYPRFLRPRIREALLDTPAVLIHGPRQCGKTTLARLIDRRYSYVTFDDENKLAAAKEDPVGFVDALPARTVLDEIQRAPFLFTALKRSIDENRRPGRFLMTGSANLMLLPQVTDSLAGRLEILRLFPLSECEMCQQNSGLVKLLFKKPFSFTGNGMSESELIQRVIRGGFPEAVLRNTPVRRRQWYISYIEAIIQRDIQDVARISALDQIPKLLLMLSNQSGQLVNVSEIAKAFQLSRPTLDHYIALLKKLFLLELLPPWFSNQNNRLIKTPKVHLADTGLACATLGINETRLAQNRPLWGRMLETFVFNELRRQASWREEPLRFFHYRDRDDYEVDIVIENQSGELTGIEVKSSATVQSHDFKGLKQLRRAASGAMKQGILLYRGKETLSFGQGMIALPMDAVWNIK